MEDHEEAQMAGWMREVLEVQEVLDVLNVLEVVDVMEVLEVLEVQIEPVVDGEEVSRRLGTPEPWAEGRGQCPGSPLLAGLGPARAGWAPEVWAEDRGLGGGGRGGLGHWWRGLRCQPFGWWRTPAGLFCWSRTTAVLFLHWKPVHYLQLIWIQ